MDPRLLQYYNRELQHIRETAAEFAKEFPKIAGRLGLEGLECADPYVERLLEGFAFLTARVQLKHDAEFPRFTQQLLEMVYPHYLSPVPSMAVVQLRPDLTAGSLATGFTVPRDTTLRTPLGKGDQTPCEYRTAHEVRLWPLELVEAEYTSYTRDMAAIAVPGIKNVRAAIRWRLRCGGGLNFAQLPLESLTFYLKGTGSTPMSLYEQLFANAVAVAVRPTSHPAPWHEVAGRSAIRRVGFEDSEALLPQGPRSFSGYRLVQEYFNFPERFLFVAVDGLGPGIRRCTAPEVEILVLLDRLDPGLQNVVDAENFGLFCAPAINLFPKRCDAIHLSDRQMEHHVVPDRTLPMDFEIHTLTRVVGSGTSAEAEQEFRPFYARNHRQGAGGPRTYYTSRREPRTLSDRQRRQGARSTYVGSEVFVSLVDADAAPYRSDLRLLSIGAMCTNRDLPLQLSFGQGRTDFTLQSGAPVAAIRCVSGPTRPRPSRAEGETAWRLISHLSLNYLSLVDTDDALGAAALRDLLLLYGADLDAAMEKQVEGVRSISSAPIHRRVISSGLTAYGRGIEIRVTFDEGAFSGSGVFLLGAVLEQFFARYASINTFTETVVSTLDRGDLIRWPARTGRRPIL